MRKKESLGITVSSTSIFYIKIIQEQGSSSQQNIAIRIYCDLNGCNPIERQNIFITYSKHCL